MKRLFACTLMLFAAAPSLAADVNGYTAQYECKAGGANCDVDVATLTAQACQQTIAAGDAWSTINWSNNVICLANGDHTAKGTLTLGSSGSSGTRKVLRYYRSGDANDEPWNQSGGNQAKVSGINTNGQSYWVIHRLTLDANYGNTSTLNFNDNTSNVIVNRALIQHANDDLVYFSGTGPTGMPTNNTLQNSVVHNSQDSTTKENDCITNGWSTNTHIVNNEIYHCNKEIFTGESADSSGLVIENNDLYDDASQYTDCNGTITPNGPCGISEAIVSMKDGAHDSSNPVKFIHNRIWGARNVDDTIGQASVSMCISVSSGGTMGLQRMDGGGTSSLLFQNNICFDSVLGVNNYWNGPQYDSFIGNIFYDINRAKSPGYAQYIEKGAISFWRLKKSEFYLNTIIKAENWLWLTDNATDNDFRCNAMIDSGAQVNSGGTGFQYDNNAYYGTPDTGEANKIVKSLTARANSTAYSLGQIIRTSATPTTSCVNGTESACFLYKVTVAGTSAGSVPTYCTTLGCITTDGTIQVEAIRGPYTFYRKLRTKPERYAIPYARTYISAPETNGCPSNYASRQGVGINN